MTLRAVVLGFGWWGRTMAAAAQEAGIDVVGVVDSAEQAVADARARGIVVIDSLDAVLRDETVDAVILCTPHALHFEQMIAALGAGRHVFCEKPLCTNVDDVTAVLELAAELGLVVGVGHERRFEPPVRALVKQADRGELGSLLVVEGNFSQDKFLGMDPHNWRLDPQVSPVGPLSATGIHLVDLSVMLLGRPVEVLARLATRGSSFANGDSLTISMAFEGGAAASLTSILATPFMGRLALFGSQGWTEVVDRAHPEAPEGWDVVTQLRDQPRRRDSYEPTSSVGANLAAFANAVKGGASYPVDAEQMLWTVAAYEAIVESVASRRPVAVRS